MSSTHEVKCRKCGIHIAWWSQFTNIQYKDEYTCQGRVWRKRIGWWQCIDSSGKKIWTSNYKPSKQQLKDAPYIKTVKPLTKELWPCSIQNYTTYCEKCAKELNYKCPFCGKELKLTRKH